MNGCLKKSLKFPRRAQARRLCHQFFAPPGVAAPFFGGRDAENGEAGLPGAKQLAALREEVIAWRDDIRALSRRPPEL